MILRRTILNHAKGTDNPCPLPPSNLLIELNAHPPLITTFTEAIICKTEATGKAESIAADIIFAVTNGQWPSAEHWLIATTL